MNSSAVVDLAARETVVREIAELAKTIDCPADLDEIQHMMPQANGDQDTW